jgi:hypothetical protein
MRITTQTIAPIHHPSLPTGVYDIYPGFPIGTGRISAGFAGLAGAIIELAADAKSVVIDGYGGVLWERLRIGLSAAFSASGLRVAWVDISRALRDPEEIDRLLEPWLGGDDPLWGFRAESRLEDLFDMEIIRSLSSDPDADLTILHGTGAALAGWRAPLVYVDIPKNEIQFRSRAGSITNLGATAPTSAKRMYKRFYFADWVMLNREKQRLLPSIDLVVDDQHPDEPVWMRGSDLRAALERMSRTCFRVRPWFEPGPWGGQWMKEHFPQLPPEAPNYAWSFELIVPENGLMLESGGMLLEISFDFLMYQAAASVLGECASLFGVEFPIRFDYLDTFGGGNLSVQCHPRPEYIRREFGERFTQDETYYITDCAPGAKVYLGFREDIDPEAFRRELERSQRDGSPVDIDRHVNTVEAEKHGLYLIPSGTVHCSGRDNLVLEISATPYIFTFKMYDWIRRDLDGAMRTLNIARAFDNLDFSRRGAYVAEALVSHPELIDEGEDWRLIHLPTHREHFYDVHRFEFAREVHAATEGRCHVLNVVEGGPVELRTAEGLSLMFNHAETFVVPAAAGSYRLVNHGPGIARVVKAFVKPLDELPATSAAHLKDEG